MIHDTLLTGIKNRQSHTELRETLFDKFGAMNRDWRRIAETEIASSMNTGQLLTELERAREGEPVFMRGVSSSEACPWCRNRVDGQVVVLVDTPPSGGGDTVMVAGKPYTAIWPGKDNYGRARRDWWVAAGTQHPHTFSKDTEVFTNRGWKLFPSLLPDDRIMALNPDTWEIDFVGYTRFVEHYQSEMIHLTGRNFDLMVTPEHRQLSLSKKTGRLIESSMGELVAKTDFSLPRAIGEWQGGRYTSIYGMSENTYARLWAWFLADGCAVHNRGSIQVAIPQKDNGDIQRDLEGLISEKGYVSAQVKHLFSDYVGVKAWEKWIPEDVKNLSPEGLRSFLDAYLHSDGHCRRGKSGHKTSYSKIRGDDSVVYTTSKRLADDLSEVIVKAGFMPNFRIQSPSGKLLQFPNGEYKTKRDVYVISICRSRFRRFSKSMGVGKIEHISYNDIAYDVSLEKWHHMLVRRNGKTAWSGNCRCTWVRYIPGYEDVEDKFKAAMEAAIREGERSQKPIDDPEKLIKPTPWT
jgi:hypothetical protein